MVQVAITFRAQPDLRDEIRGAVRALQREEPSFSRDELIRDAVRSWIDLLAKYHNNGRAFRRVRTQLKAGRRPGDDADA